jgi:hypothetical protein
MITGQKRDDKNEEPPQRRPEIAIKRLIHSE